MREMLALVRGCAARVGLAAGDVVEVSPPYDPAGATAVAAANVAFELVSLLSLASA